MKFNTPCFVRVEDAKKRKELRKWLFDIGYGCQDGVDPNYSIVVCSLDDGNVDVAPTQVVDSFTGIGLHNCGTDIELFKALAAMNDENDREQWFTGELNGEKLWWKCNQSDKHERFLKGKLLRKASVEEIIELYKNE